MSIRYANVINHLPETKMRHYPTKVINIIGGPGSDKSLFSAAIVLYLTRADVDGMVGSHRKAIAQVRL